jgi:hypothetical protein
VFARIIGKIRIADRHLYSSSPSLRLPGGYTHSRVDSEKDLYHYRDSHHSYYRHGQDEHEEIVQLFHRFYRLQSTAFPDSIPGPVTKEGYRLAVGSRQLAKEEVRKRRNEETGKRRREVEGFPKRLDPGFIYRSLIMSKTISLSFEPGKEVFFSSLQYSTAPLLQQFFERRHPDLFFFTGNRYDSNTTAVSTEKSLAGTVEFPTYFFEPRRHLQCGKKREGTRRREEEKKRRNEETGKRRIEVEGFHKRLEPGSVYRSMVMSKNISHVVNPGTEAFQMVRRALIGPPRRGVDPGKEAFPVVRMGLFRAVTPGGSPRMQFLPFSGRTRGSPLPSPRAWYSGNKTGESRGEPCVRPYPEFRWFLLFPGSFPGAAPWGPGSRRQEGNQLAPLLQELSEHRHSDLFFFVKNRYDSNTTAVTTEKSLTGTVKFPTHFFEPRRHAKGREEEKKRRNEETEKRRLEGEGFPKRLEPDSLYRLMIMSKNISHVVNPGTEAFQMARRTLIGPSRYAPRRGVDPGKEAFQMARMRLLRAVTPGGSPRMQFLLFSGRTRGSPLRSPRAWYSDNKTGEGRGEPCVRPYPEFRWFLLFPDSFPGAAPWGSGSRRQEGNQLADGNWQLARREAEGFHMARRAFYGSPRRGADKRGVFTGIIPKLHEKQNGRHSFVSSLQYSTSSFLRRLLESGDVKADVFTKGGRRPQPHARHGQFPTLKRFSQTVFSSANFSRVLVKGGRQPQPHARHGQFPTLKTFSQNIVVPANDTNTAGISFQKAPALDYFTPHRVSVGNRDQPLIDVGKPMVPGMDVKDKVTGEHIFDNYAGPGIRGVSQQHPPNIDIDQLTDRVYRVLEDKIRTEKEMRGW